MKKLPTWLKVFTGISFAFLFIVMIISYIAITPEDRARYKREEKIKDSLDVVNAKRKDSLLTKPKSESPSKNNHKERPDVSYAVKLAMIDAHSFIDSNDIKVIRMKRLLNDLSERFNEPIDSIANITSQCSGVLHDVYGIDFNNLEMLEAMNKAAPTKAKIKNSSYRDMATLLTFYIEKSY